MVQQNPSEAVTKDDLANSTDSMELEEAILDSVDTFCMHSLCFDLNIKVGPLNENTGKALHSSHMP